MKRFANALATNPAWLFVAAGSVAPSVNDVVPDNGSAGDTVTIYGADFGTPTAVRFGATDASSFTQNADGTITAVAPAGSGVQDVSVTNAAGTGTSKRAFTYTGGAVAPTLSSANYTQGDTVGGGQPIVLTGTWDVGSAVPQIDGVDLGAGTYTVDSATQITFTLPAHAAGAASITVRDAGGTSGGLAFTYWGASALLLYGWWQASYAGSPWGGSASAGSSGSRPLSEATNPPTVGTPVGGFNPASFDGVDDLLTAFGQGSDYYSAAAYSGWALVNLVSSHTDSATAYLNDAILSAATSAAHGVTVRSSGLVQAFSYDTSSGLIDGPTSAFSFGVPQLVQWKYDGTNLKIRVNGGAWTSSARSNLGAAWDTQGMQYGKNPNSAPYLDGDALDLALTNVAISDADFDRIRAYMNQRYGVSV